MARPEAYDRFQPYRECRQRIARLRRQVRELPEHLGPGPLPSPTPRLISPSRAEELEWRRAYTTPVEEGEAQESPDILEAKRRKALRAVWRRQVGPAPVCGPGDVQAARRYLDKLHEVQDYYAGLAQDEERHDLAAPLTRSEQAYLRMQIRKWERRVKGEDPRFNKAGTRAGRPRLPRVLS